METRNIKITLDTARRMYEKGGEFKEIALLAYTEDEIFCDSLPNTWERFCRNNPKTNCEYYIGGFSNICMETGRERKYDADKNCLPSKEAAEAHLALMQLHQLRDCYRQGWLPAWKSREGKFCIGHYNDCYRVEYSETVPYFLAFQSEEIAEEFLRNFQDLIEQAGDLI